MRIHAGIQSTVLWKQTAARAARRHGVAITHGASAIHGVAHAHIMVV